MSHVQSRRTFLRRASVIAPAIVIPAAASMPALAAGPAECPHLLAWGEKIEALATEFIAARANRKQAVALYHSLRPVPEELVVTQDDWRLFGFCGREERDWLGAGVYPVSERRHIFSLNELESLLDDYAPRSKRARIVRRKIEVARAYEETKEPAEEASGVWAAQKAFRDAQSALEDAMRALEKLTPRTMDGVVVKAGAMLAYAKTSPETYGRTWVSLIYGNDLAADVVRLTGAGAVHV